MWVADFHHVLGVIGDDAIVVGVFILVNTRNGPVLFRPGINLFLRVENANHPKAMKHSNWPSNPGDIVNTVRSEEHTSELQSLMRTSYAVFCLKKKNTIRQHQCTINDNILKTLFTYINIS